MDDEPDAVEFVRAIVEEAGCEAVCASNGKEALDKVASEKPDLVVADVMMPETDGFAFCARLRSSPDAEDLPVVLLTGVADHVHDSKYPLDGVMRADAQEYLEKPVQPEELLETISGLLG